VRAVAASSALAPRLALITFGVMLATIMQALDTTIANVALPHMQGSFAASQDQIAWVLTSYIVAAAIMTPPTGWISNRFGRKRYFLFSVAGFTIASALCGLATSLTGMVIFRLLQGVFGAALVPLSQATLLDAYPRERHGPAMAIWGMGIMVGPILGPTLGGWLTEHYSWRWVFYINLPIGILAFLIVSASVQETVKRRGLNFDFFGFALISLTLGALQMFLDRGEQKDWFGSTEIIVEAVLAGLFLYMFVVHSLTAKNPFINPQVFTDRNLTVSMFFMAAVGAVLYGSTALTPPFLQNLLNYPVVTTGLVMGPRGIGTMFAMMIVGRTINRVDVRLMLTFGFGLLAYSLWWMVGFSLNVPIWEIVVSGLLQGFGLGFVFVPMTTIAFSTLRPELRNEGTGIYNLMRNIGASAGISALTALLIQNIQVNHSSLAAHVTPFNRALQDPALHSFWNLHSASGLAALNAEVGRQAAMIAYIDDFKALMLLTLAMLPLIWLLSPARKAPGLKPVPVD